MSEAMEKIKQNKVYQQVLADSMGGIMYNVSNLGKYDADQVLALWEALTPAEREAAGGIMKGAINFLKEGSQS